MALSLTGLVFGMQHTEVKPPAAAALVPVSIVSECSKPGSRRGACMSMNPGATIRPVALKISAAVASKLGPMAAIRSPSRSTSVMASWFEAGSMTRPFLISRRAMLREDPFEDGHAHGDAIADL